MMRAFLFHSTFSVILTLLFVSVAGCSEQPPSKANGETNDVWDAELSPLTMKLKSYIVTDLPVTEALKQVWIQAVGKEPGSSIVWHTEPNHPEPKISLDVTDLTASTIIRHITELASCTLEIKGMYSHNLVFNLIPMTVIDDAGFTIRTITLSNAGAHRLGFQKNMRSPELVAQLERYGLKFDKTRGWDHIPYAYYNWETGQLVASLPISEASYVEALARLADRDQLAATKP